MWVNRNSPKSARLSFHCKPINRGKGAPQAAHTDAPRKNRRQLPSAGISSAVFFAYASLTSSENWEKNCQSEQDVDQTLYSRMEGRQCENKQHGDTVPEKEHDIFYVLYRSILKKCTQMCFSTAGYVCSTQTRFIINPSVVRLELPWMWHICPRPQG